MRRCPCGQEVTESQYFCNDCLEEDSKSQNRSWWTSLCAWPGWLVWLGRRVRHRFK